MRNRYAEQLTFADIPNGKAPLFSWDDNRGACLYCDLSTGEVSVSRRKRPLKHGLRKSWEIDALITRDALTRRYDAVRPHLQRIVDHYHVANDNGRPAIGYSPEVVAANIAIEEILKIHYSERDADLVYELDGMCP